MSKCRGKIRRSYGEYPCGQNAVYAVRADDVVAGACRQHLPQVIDDTGIATVTVIRLGEW